MVREHLSQELKEAGLQLLAVTDSLDMQAQGAMWVYNHVLHDWRYYLVTSLVETVGRRKTYQLLLQAFESVNLPESMTIADVHLGSTRDGLFQLLSRMAGYVGGSWLGVENCLFDNVRVDGVVYRSVQEPVNSQQTGRIEKRFTKRVKEISSQAKTTVRA